MKAEKVLRIGQPGNRFKRVLEGCTELSIDINFIGFGHDAYSVKRASIFCVFYLRIKCMQCSTGNGFLTGTGTGNGNGKKCRERE